MTGGIHFGGCACGSIRFQTRGAPKRVGLCHCMTCRKAHAGAFNPFVVFDQDQVAITGELSSWASSPGYERKFCAACGSRVAGETEGEVELSIGSFDEAGRFVPQYECWTRHREPWLAALELPQYDHERTSPGPPG